MLGQAKLTEQGVQGGVTHHALVDINNHSISASAVDDTKNQLLL